MLSESKRPKLSKLSNPFLNKISITSSGIPTAKKNPSIYYPVNSIIPFSNPSSPRLS